MVKRKEETVEEEAMVVEPEPVSEPVQEPSGIPAKAKYYEELFRGGK